MATAKELLDRMAIVLVRPKIPENIGAAARIAWNMGINRLILVRDSLPERETMAKMATHKAAHLIDNMELYATLDEALAEFTYIIGTSARKGKQRFVLKSPREIAQETVPILPRNKVAVLFGPEDTGLTNEELKFCHAASSIPTADFSSINLAQAVAIHCYEFYYTVTTSKKNQHDPPALATSFELESMYAHLEESLLTISFIEDVNRYHWMSNVRNLLGRIQLTSKDANIIRGICKKFLVFHNKNSTQKPEDNQ